MQKCFVISPFKEPFNDYYKKIYKPAIEKADLKAERGDEVYSSRAIIDDIFNSIIESEVVLCDVTGINPNVIYELGVAHALKKPAIILTQSVDHVPFDFRHLRVISYDTKQVKWDISLGDEISKTILSLRSDPKNGLAWNPQIDIDSDYVMTNKDQNNEVDQCSADWKIYKRKSRREGSDIFSADSSDLYFLLLSVQDCERSRILVEDVRAADFSTIAIEAMYDLMGTWDLLIKFRSSIDPNEFKEKVLEKLIASKMMQESEEEIFGHRRMINVVSQSMDLAGLLEPRENETIYHTLLPTSEEYDRYRASRAFLFLEALGNPKDEQRKNYIRELSKAMNGKLGGDIIESVCEGESEIVIETFSSCSQSNHINHVNKSVERVLTTHGLQKYTLTCYFYDENGLLSRT